MDRKKKNEEVVAVHNIRPVAGKSESVQPHRPQTALNKNQGPIEVQMPKLAEALFALKFGESSGQALAKELEDLVEAAKQEISSGPEEFFGILGRCAIKGNDCHLLDHDLKIIAHVHISQNIAPEFMKARSAITKVPASIIAILVFSDHLEYLFSNGSIQRAVE